MTLFFAFLLLACLGPIVTLVLLSSGGPVPCNDPIDPLEEQRRIESICEEQRTDRARSCLDHFGLLSMRKQPPEASSKKPAVPATSEHSGLLDTALFLD